jgi:hypothetical protein
MTGYWVDNLVPMTSSEAAAHEALDWSCGDVLGMAYASELVRSIDAVLKLLG